MKIYGVARFTFDPADRDAFRTQAQTVMEVARQDLTGTQAYEWFMSRDKPECTVIEIYDGMAGLTHHMRAVGKVTAALGALASLSVDFAGDIPPEAVERYRRAFAKVDYSGRRLFGKARAPASGAASAAPCQKIFAVTRFAIHPGQEARFLELAEDCFNLVDETEPGTSLYEWFLNESGTQCLTIDAYDSIEALTAHTRNAGPRMNKILELVTSSVEMFGAVPPVMLQRFRPELGVSYIGPQFQGIL